MRLGPESFREGTSTGAAEEKEGRSKRYKYKTAIEYTSTGGACSKASRFKVQGSQIKTEIRCLSYRARTARV
jgi:hypothetical protein